MPGEWALSSQPEGNGSKAESVAVDFTLPADAAPGIYALRVANQEGISNPKLVLIEDLPVEISSGSNQSFEAAQMVSFPVAIDGFSPSLAKHFYKFSVAEAQRLSVEVYARRIGSMLDPVVYLYDASGRILTYADDSAGLQRDCQLEYQLPAAGEYLIEIRDIEYKGGNTHPYHLRLGNFPLVHTAYPLAIPAGQETSVSLIGSSPENDQTVAITGSADKATAALSAGSPSGTAFLALPTSTEPLFNETEPNDDAAAASPVTTEVGFIFNGKLDPVKDIDQFKFTGKPEQWYLVKGVSEKIWLPSRPGHHSV
ncbi:MAG: PPC domain-containing protein [Planctomycetaceae bacterium]